MSESEMTWNRKSRGLGISCGFDGIIRDVIDIAQQIASFLFALHEVGVRGGLNRRDRFRHSNLDTRP